MKKILLAVTAVLAITSCSQNEEFENPAQKTEIGFNTIVSNTTRAAVTDIEGLKKSGFTVYAYNTGAEKVGAALTNPIMDGLAVTHPNGGNWTFTGTYYWPFNDYVQFFAYATDVAVTEYSVAGEAGYPTLKYAIASTADQQKDFVVAKVLDQQKIAEALQLSFSHALTQINFSVIGVDNNKYKISSISIEGVAASGVYSFETGKWTATSNETSGKYTYPIAADASVSSSTTAVALDQPNGALMLMPQAMTENANIKINYSVYSGETQISQSESTIQLKETSAWEAGKKVRYTLKLANGAASMTFAPEVGPWSTTDDTPVNGDAQ